MQIHAAKINPNDLETSNDDMVELMVASQDITLVDTQNIEQREMTATEWCVIGYTPDGFLARNDVVLETEAPELMQGMDVYDPPIELDYAEDGNHTIRVIMRALGTPIEPRLLTDA